MRNFLLSFMYEKLLDFILFEFVCGKEREIHYKNISRFMHRELCRELKEETKIRKEAIM